MSPLIVHVVFRLDYGGLENGVINLVDSLSAAGHYRHAIVTLTNASSFVERLRADIPVYCIGKRPGKDLGAYFRLLRLLRELRPSIVHTRNVGTLDCAFVAFLAGIPIRIHGEHGWDTLDPDGKSRKYRLFRRLFAPFVHRFVTVSQHLFTWLTTVVGISPNKVVRICNGVDTDRFHPGQPEKVAELRAKVPLEPGLVIGSVTRFSAIKDPLNLVDAFVQLREDWPSSGLRPRLLMVGDGELHGVAVRRLGDAGAAADAWLPGARSDIPALLQCMDLFVLGSLREGISNTILEAMASGLPVVATNTGGNGELVTDGETGKLVKPADSVALAEAIRFYAGGIRSTHGANARRDAVARFSLPVMVEQYRSLYAQLLRDGQTPEAGCGVSLNR